MKAITLQKRIIANLCFKNGNVKPSYMYVLRLLRQPSITLHLASWHRAKGHCNLTDYTDNTAHGLALLGIRYEIGNDSPRGGAEGRYIRLTPAGRRQVAEYSKEFAI